MERKTRADYEKGRRRTERTRSCHTHESKVNEIRKCLGQLKNSNNNNNNKITTTKPERTGKVGTRTR